MQAQQHTIVVVVVSACPPIWGMVYLESVVVWTLWSSWKREDLEIRMWQKGEPIEREREDPPRSHI
jgi:hypothetical protein